MTYGVIDRNAAGQSAQGAGRVVTAIRQASERTGVDFSYMLQKAQQESGLNPTVKAQGSSATGLYQFVEQTWLRTIKEHGAAYGLSREAEQISITSQGKAVVSDAAAKATILELRKNPDIASFMAAELAKDNKEKLQQSVGGEIGATELYLSHFLGAGGASQFLNRMRDNPQAKAADLLPSAASANKAVFYAKDGRAKSLAEVYAGFSEKFEGRAGEGRTALAQAKMDSSLTSTHLASVGSLGSLNSGLESSGRNAWGEESFSGAASARRVAPVSLDHSLSHLSSSFAAMILDQMDYGVL